jgi:thiamine biosynthesis lipoprotein
MNNMKSLQMFGKEDGLKLKLYDIEEPLLSTYIIEIYSEAKRLERIFNLYDKDSELNNLNSKREMQVSKELFEVITKALEFCRMTSGAYDISIGKNVLARKIGKDMQLIECTYKDIIAQDGKVKLSHTDVIIDLGSIAKGYIVDKLIVHIKSLGILSGLVDARGDIRIFGEDSEIIEVQHPRKKDKTISPIRLKDMAIATSGDYSQYYGSFENSHIIGKSEIISATVASNSLADADAVATCLMCLDMNKAKGFLRKCRYSALLINKKQELHFYNRFRELGAM